MIQYRIRRKSDGTFSTGGSNPYFTKGGKIWKTKHHLNAHLNIMNDYSNNRISYAYFNPKLADEYEIVQYQVTEIEDGTLPVEKIT